MYGIITTVPAPVEMYDAVHAEIIKRVGTPDGMLVHVGRATTNGFQVLEVAQIRADPLPDLGAVEFPDCSPPGR